MLSRTDPKRSAAVCGNEIDVISRKTKVTQMALTTFILNKKMRSPISDFSSGGMLFRASQGENL
jgi:hypothetical protein